MLNKLIQNMCKEKKKRKRSIKKKNDPRMIETALFEGALYI